MKKQLKMITRTEFELDEVPTVEEFQKIYDEGFRLFQQKGLV